MKFAYADPPYFGSGGLYSKQHKEALLWNEVKTHRDLIESLKKDFPDGWAMSLSSPSLQVILPMCPGDVRVGAWVKPFCIFKPNVPVAYAWEPVIFRGGRKRGRDEPTTRDWVAESITLKRGLTGAKPRAFCRWIFDLLGAQKGDELHDLFPGTGAVQFAWDEYVGARPEQSGLFAEITS